MATAIALHLATVIGRKVVVQMAWGTGCDPQGGGPHVGTDVLGVYPLASSVPGLKEVDPSRWPMQCDHCPATAPMPGDLTLRRALIDRPCYDTPSGDPEPGSLLLDLEDHSPERPCSYGWTNCDGRHPVCVLPGGWRWDLNSRAANCTRRDEHTHRCWVVHGDAARPETLHVDKAGHTCAAGAGSIQSYGRVPWHGFLEGGKLVER